MSASYDRFASRYEEIFEQRQREKIERLSQVISFVPNGHFLDAGCGTGLASRILGRPFVSLDRSLGMLSQAPGPRVRGDITALPFLTNSFDLIVSISVVLDSTPMDMAFQEFFRVLKPNGTLAVSLLKTEDLTRAEFLLNDLFNQHSLRIDLGPDLGFVVEKPVRSL